MEEILAFLQSKRIANAKEICLGLVSLKMDIPYLASLNEEYYPLSQMLYEREDRKALIEWSKEQVQLKKNLPEKSPTRSPHSRSNNQSGEPNAVKPARSPNTLETKRYDILIGWLHFDETENRYKQVTKSVGGGLRSIKILVESTVDDLLKISKQLFFSKSSINMHGSWDSLNVEIFDFNRVTIDQGTTVHDLYAQAGLLGQLPLLKCYLATRKKPENISTKLQKSVDPTSKVTSTSSTKTKTTATSNELNAAGPSFAEVDFIGCEPTELTKPDPEKKLQKTLASKFSLLLSDDDQGDNNLYFSNFYGANQGERVNPRNSVPNQEVYFHVELHRGNVFQEMIDAFVKMKYTKDTIVCTVFVQVDDTPEQAVDSGGVFRDAITEFWNTMYQTCTSGATLKIPHVRHNFGADQWKAMAKILYLSWTNGRYLPIKLAMPILEQMIFGQITSDLVHSFLQTLRTQEKSVLSRALVNINSVDNDTLMEILGNLGCRVIPNENNLKTILEQIAHMEFVQKPRFIIEQFREELEDKFLLHLTVTEVLKLHKLAEPTAENILNNMTRSFSNVNDQSIKTYAFLEKYIEEGSEDARSRFVRYCTGADIITDMEISIEFDHSDIFASGPLVNTCSGILSLPSNYATYADFQAEMNYLLFFEDWIMDLE